MYTTSQVAERLNLTSKKVLLLSKKGELQLEKSSTGSYLFSEQQINQIQSILEESNQNKGIENEFLSQLTDLTKKMKNVELKLDTKANEVVSVQILEHRSEIEELKKLVNRLDNQISQLNETVNNLKNEIEEQKKVVAFRKSKKRYAILSIFGI